MSGTDLGALLAAGEGLEPGHAIALVGQVAAALEREHARGFAHGALEPGNILIEGDRAWPAGFGGGWEPRDGTPEFVAPELLLGALPSPRSDVYSLACVLCAALTGRAPERGRVPAGVARELAPVLERALALEPARRPGDAMALMHDVRVAAARADAAPAGARRPWWRSWRS